MRLGQYPPVPLLALLSVWSVTLFSVIVDGHIVLDRALAQHGHFPAVNISKSLSRVFRDIAEPADQKAAASVRDALATYAEVEDLLEPTTAAA